MRTIRQSMVMSSQSVQLFCDHHGNGKAFCAGGDLMAFYKLVTEVKVALIDGVVMGGGAGGSMQAPYRIVTEKTVFAMPAEAAIGLFPDIGASHFLSRVRDILELQMLEKALEELTSSDTSAISQLISKFVHQANVKQVSKAYYNKLKIVNKCFSRQTVEDILLALEEKKAKNGEQEWMVTAILLGAVTPIITGICEYFNLGLRATILDKNKKPKWRPSKLELATKEILDKYFTAVDDDNWELARHFA